MLPSNGRKPKVRRNYHMTTRELQLVFKHAAKYGLKWQVLAALQAFRGLRLSEALAVNISDFSDNFNKLTYREAKVNKIQPNRPLIEPLAKLCRLYARSHKNKLRQGYFFCHYTRLNPKDGRPFMNVKVANNVISQLRQDISKEHPGILEHYKFLTDSGREITRYRVSWHSLRRWFETNLKEKSDVFTVKTIMDYSKYEVLNHYLSNAEIMKNEKAILEDALSPIAREICQD